jgi:hypothetical protein
MLTKYFRKSGTIDRIQSSWICEPITQYKHISYKEMTGRKFNHLESWGKLLPC